MTGGVDRAHDVHMARSIGIDIGATWTSGVLLGEWGDVLRRTTPVHTPELDSADLIRLLLEIVDELQVDARVSAVGVACAGRIRYPQGRIEQAVNHSHGHFELRRRLRSRLAGVRVVVDNDGNAAAWAEYRMDARIRRGRGVLVLAVGTGLGSGLVANGVIFRGQDGMGMELGHVVSNPAGRRCGCGIVGCLETEVSGRALTRAGLARMEQELDGELARFAAEPGREDTFVSDAALVGVPAALELIAEAGTRLGAFVAGQLNAYAVDQIVVSGGLTAAVGDLLLNPMRTECRRLLPVDGHPRMPVIRRSALGDDGAMIGAGLLALEHGRTGRGYRRPSVTAVWRWGAGRAALLGLSTRTTVTRRSDSQHSN